MWIPHPSDSFFGRSYPLSPSPPLVRRGFQLWSMICQYQVNIGQFFHESVSWLEHFPIFNKQGVWNKNVLGGKFSKIISGEGTSLVAHRCQSKKNNNKQTNKNKNKIKMKNILFRKWPHKITMAHLCQIRYLVTRLCI